MLLEGLHLVKRSGAPYHLAGTQCQMVPRDQCPGTLGEAKIPFQFLKFEHSPPVARVTLDRPLDNNRINAAMAEEIRQACAAIGEDDSLGVMVLTGSGDCFSVGRSAPGPSQDTETAASVDIGAAAGWLDRRRVAGAVAALPMPVLVALNGDALDHGLELALAGDLRIASESARFGLTQVSGGAMPWDGGTQRLPRLVGPAWARDLVLTGRTIDAAQALAIGLVNRVEPAERLAAAIEETVQGILAGGPIAARYAKEAVKKGADLSLPQGLGLEADLNVILQSTQDRAEGIRSFIQRRPPKYTGS